jgi:hypothetical protein
MKLPTANYRLGIDAASIARALAQLLPQFAIQINNASEGQISGAYNALDSMPTSGAHAQGDYVRNRAPAETGTTGAKYVVKGWICTAGGTPGTWVEDRGITGA